MGFDLRMAHYKLLNPHHVSQAQSRFRKTLSQTYFLIPTLSCKPNTHFETAIVEAEISLESVIVSNHELQKVS